MTTRGDTGTRGESAVASHLEGLGYEIVARNARVGRLELDLIAFRAGVLVFCEVRTRRSDTFMDPIESIDRKKVHNLRKAAAGWLAAHGFRAAELRFDAASVLCDREPPQITYYENAF